MRSMSQTISPQAVLWESMREAAREAEALERTRRALDDQEVEALATLHAEARRAKRLAATTSSKAGVTAGR